MPDLQSEILVLLEARGPLDFLAIAGALNAHPITVHRICADLGTAGYLREDKGGIYELTPSGKRLFDITS